MSLDEVSSGERWEEMNRFGISIIALTGLVDRLDGWRKRENGSKAFVGTTGGHWCCLLSAYPLYRLT